MRSAWSEPSLGVLMWKDRTLATHQGVPQARTQRSNRRRPPRRGDGACEVSDYWVTVCSACRTASCWHGEFMCDRFRDAGTIDVLASAIRGEDRENRSNYSIRKIREVCGSVRYADQAMERGKR